MKKLILLVVILFTTLITFSQESRYENLKSLAKLQGYTIGAQKYCDIAQDNIFYNDITFWEGYEYMIVACSDNYDVYDIDLYLMNETDIILKDEDDDATPIITFEVRNKQTFRIVAKNIRSKYPDVTNSVQFFVAYKKLKL